MSEKMKEKPKHDHVGRWVLFATISASSMAFISGSALNVALPAIQNDLGATGADLLWIVNIYALFLAALILVGGSLGDHYGRKRIYMIGIVLFTAMSVLGGLAPTTSILIAARAAQGVGGALMVPGSLAIISAYFSGEERSAAIGTWSAFTTLTSVAGPLLGGVLAEAGLWRLIFFMAVPLALASLYALVRYVPESRDEEISKELDFVGAGLVTLGLAGVTYGAIEIGRIGAETGLQNPLLVGSLVGGVVLLVVFVIWEARSAHPMMPLFLFRSRTFTGANLLTFFLYGALGAALLFLPLNLIQVQGYGETVAGFALLPFSILLMLLSPWAGRLVDRIGPRIPLTIGPLLVAGAFIGLSLPQITNGPQDYWVSFFPPALLLGLGMGITVAPLTSTVMGAVPQQNSGIASGINNAMSRASQVVSTAIMGGVALLLFTSTLSGNLAALDLSQEAQTTMLEQAADLAATPIPDTLNEEQSGAAQRAVHLAFVATFRAIMLIAAAMCALSALLAAVIIEKELEQPETLRTDEELAAKTT